MRFSTPANPTKPSSRTRDPDGPEPATFGGYFEDLGHPISFYEKHLKPPFKVVGTRKPGNFRFLSWDPNISLFRDHLNQHLYITFEDAEGTVFGPVCYRADITTWGAKFEVGIRYKAGYLMKHTKEWPVFDRIPETLKVSSGYDGGFTLAAIGLTMSKFDFVDSDTPGVKNMFVRYYGWGNAMGLTMITGSKPDKLSTDHITNEYRRLPYLFKSSWEPKEQAIVVAGHCIYLLLWFFYIGEVLMTIITGTPPELEEESTMKPQVNMAEVV
jgi:hypothetical protein|eukprot:CAMPEP_0174300412 /NCGR_PEP_ID=MMETSP0809-20121228/58447_1 /TAXON_ID=73025 ORGANISM="Eutreptiella gymnastica-like, Strain CCMP1594" /NCGR_SAMPLE_ID=MMETSP0809 /ASSEMBLY_ACC=CAM_ASM_000658 /LENGTH=269 /DNA_ID=CAMNT_0015405985 /DNA_START=78 /DNA_END=887 /DNA_ORIENTATION=-